MHSITRIGATFGLAAAAFIGSLGAAHGVSAREDVVGHVYVNDNTAGQNTVAAFDQHSNGSLTPLTGSPFAVGGGGAGVITGAQGALQISSDGRFLLAVDAGSNQISVARIRPDGSLRPVEDGPFASNGSTPISIAVHENLVYVANAGDANSNYTGFTLARDGRLRPLNNSTVALPAGSGPGDVLFSADGTHLAGTRINTSQIDSFTVDHDGRLTAAPGSPFTAQALGPFGSEYRPTNPSQLFVSNAHAGPGKGTVSAFSVAGNGSLQSIGASPYTDGQTAPCWVEISHDGRYLFSVNTGSSSISRYSIGADGILTLIGSTAINQPTGLRPFDLRLDPRGHFLYVVDAGRNAVSEFAVDGGSLTELSASPVSLPAGATPFGIVVTSGDQHDGEGE